MKGFLGKWSKTFLFQPAIWAELECTNQALSRGDYSLVVTTIMSYDCYVSSMNHTIYLD